MLLQIAHALALVLLPHPLLASNYFQMACPLLAAGVCLQQRTTTRNQVARRCWLAIASSFAIWALAESCYIFFLYFPERGHATVRPDDALWVLFGLPILLAVNTTHENADWIGWLDRLQVMIFFAVLYLLSFLPSIRLDIDTSFLIQDVALILCCLLRLPISSVARERRFFVRVSLFLMVYGPFTMAGDILHRHGWPAGGLVDLVWTVPTTFYTLLVLADAWHFKEPVDSPSRLVTVVRSMQGISISILAFLSLAVSALLATHRPLLGSGFLAASFVLFAMRTNARERAWQHAHGRLEETVLQDALTGLGNRLQLRRSLTELLAHSPAEGTAVLLFADLDHFKGINDSLGHALGDRLLVDVGKRLRAAASADSMVCRLGGDEFVVLTTAGSPGRAKAQGQALLEALHMPFHLGDHILRCTASIGVVLAAAGDSADNLLRTADHAMYRAKQLGKDRVQLFDASLLAQMNSRWQMEADLRGCVERNEIEVAFQPILTVEGGEISGFEALARWTHPTQGPIPPLDFIPMAEGTGLILSLGAQILEKACSQVASWNRAWNTRLSVSVNVSPRQFADTGLLAMLLSTLDRTGLEPALLRLEITESALLVHESTVKHVLGQARAHGIRISLDDFGTGYSS
ncbi:MAG: putative bifunctional diguanylate cyclase/phosphodiesterase, partial [Janthinobacterium lividum]